MQIEIVRWIISREVRTSILANNEVRSCAVCGSMFKVYDDTNTEERFCVKHRLRDKDKEED